MKANVTDKLFLISVKTHKELTSNITFQPNKIFVRKDLFEKIIKSCKATNLEFLKLKEKLGLCLYEDICNQQELILTSKEIFKEEKIFTQDDVENKQLKKENEKLRRKENEKLRKEENEKLRKENEQLKKENEQLRKNNVVTFSIKRPIEIKSPKEDKNTADYYPNWFDRNKFEKILAIIDSNKFTYRNKIAEFEYVGIRDFLNNIRNNTISEISARKGLNTLNDIKDAEIIKYKKRTTKHEELLNLFNGLLYTILTDKTLMSSKDENEKENEKENKNEKRNENANENENENENGKALITIKKLNDDLDEMIDKSESFEDHIKLLRKVENIIEYYHYEDYGDKELRFKYFKIELAHLSNEIDEKLFEKIFGHKFKTLTNKLINTTNKKENQIIVNNIEKNKDKLYEMDPFYNYVIQPGSRRVDLIDAINFILNFNQTI